MTTPSRPGVPCSCAMTHQPSEAVQPASGKSKGAPHGAFYATPTPSTASSSCFYCLCTVCGRGLSDIPALTCTTCGSQTHITCARDVYSHEWLLTEVGGSSKTAASASAANTTASAAASSSSRKRRRPSESASAATVTHEAPPPDASSSSGAGHEHSHLHPSSRESPFTAGMPSPQALSTVAAKIDKEYNYYCHPDCAMGMEVMRNPQFNAALSARIEAAFALEWQHTWEMVVERLRDGGMGQGLNARDHCMHVHRVEDSTRRIVKKEKGANDSTHALSQDPSTTPVESPACPSASVFERLQTSAGDNRLLGYELSRLFSQLRAEAWADYFERERHHSGHPLFYPPPFLDVQREAALSHVLEAASPPGQAARLYLLDPATHPVGSAVVIPVGVLARWQQPAVTPFIKVNDSNNFVAEAALAVANDTVVPETVTVYRNCHKEGRVVST